MITTIRESMLGFFAESSRQMLSDLVNHLYRIRCLALIDKLAEA